MPKAVLELTVNGRGRQDLVPENMLLIDYLREVAGLSGTKQGKEDLASAEDEFQDES